MLIAFITTFKSHQMPGSFKDIIQTQATQIRSLDWEDPSRKWQPTPIFLLGKFHGQGGRRAKVHGMAKIWTRLSDLAHTHERTHAHTHTHTTTTEDGEGLRG